MRELNVGMIYDDALRAGANAAKQNYWYRYTEEIAAQLGMPLQRIAPGGLADALPHYSALFVGGGVDAHLSDRDVQGLEAWIKAGGVLIGFAPERLDRLFGVQKHRVRAQPMDDYTVAGYFSLRPGRIGDGVHSIIRPNQNVLILSDVRVPSLVDAESIADLHDGPVHDGRDDAREPAITERSVGLGKAYYFAFDVPKTIWLMHQGKPMWHDLDGDGWLRTQDMTVIGEHTNEVMYADELKFLIQKMIAHHPVPLIHQIPPLDGKIADAFFHYGGDDEGSDKGVQLVASNFMREMGLPYEINAMPLEGAFHISDADLEQIKANGHVVSLHYNFINGFAPGDGITHDDIKRQITLYKQTYGRTPIVTVNHWCRWYGWTEPARWMLEEGQIGSHDFIHKGFPPANPKDVFSFAFGTALPFRFYEDYERGNERLDFIELPHNAYEIGRTANEAEVDWQTTKNAIDTAVRYQVPLSMFLHPVYPATYENARQAVKNSLAYIAEIEAAIKHMTADDAAIWWKERGESRITSAESSASGVRIALEVAHPDGVVVKLPADRVKVAAVSNQAGPLHHEVRRVLGTDWLMIVVPHGVQHVDISCAPA